LSFVSRAAELRACRALAWPRPRMAVEPTRCSTECFGVVLVPLETG
jgi:hypothetical protein